MDQFYRKLIGKTVGKVLDINVEANDRGWGKFLRVQVELNLTKPLAQVWSLQVRGKML